MPTAAGTIRTPTASETLEPDVAVAKGFHRRHGVRIARRPPNFLGLGVARNADIARDLVVIGRDILIGDRPVVRAVVLALDPEVIGQQPRKVSEIVQRGSADAPAALVTVGDRILAFE